MVFGLMAFGAAGAQAEVGAKWLILTAGEKPLLKTGAELHASVNLEIEKNEKGEPIPLVLHSEILKIKTLFLCTALEAINAKLQEEGIIGSTVVTNETTKLKEGRGSQVKFSGCTTDLNGVVEPKCVPTEAVTGNKGIIITKLGHALLKLHELTADKVKDDITKILPDSGETFATIQTGPLKENECPIATSVPVIGSLALKDCENLALTHLVKHLTEAFTPLTELWTISKTVEHVATLLGSSWAFLTGAEHVGLKWSGDPA
jgi:hypothetical protein